MSSSEGSIDLANSALTGGWINVSGSTTGTISPANDSDWFKVYLVSGVKYSFTMGGPQVDSYLFLRDASGVAVGYLNGVGAGVTETGAYTPTSTAFYYIDAQATGLSPGNTGTYTITVGSNVPDDYAANTNTTSTLALSQAKSGSIEIASDADWHKLSLIAGTKYEIAVAGGTLLNPWVAMYDSAGTKIGSSYPAAEYFTPAVSGTFFAEISDLYMNEIGTYTVQAWAIPVASISNAAITEGNSGTKNLVFTISLSAASPINISVQVDTKDETAVAGTDYQAIHQVVNIAAGSTTGTVSVPIIGNTQFQPARVFEVNLSNPVGAIVNSFNGNPFSTTASPGNAWGVIFDDDAPSTVTLPTDTYFPYEWYLYNVRAEFAWQHATGVGIKVGIFDQGVDPANPDLTVNDNLALGRSAATLAVGGVPILATDNHGTTVAGVIAAARDGVGVVGVAYSAQIVSIYNTLTSAEITNAFSYAKSLDVLNNSWGFASQSTGVDWAFSDNANSPEFLSTFRALKDLATTGRSGLGTNVVQSAGNSYNFDDDTNLHNFQNSRYIITVASTDYFGYLSPFSTTGASILVSAPGGDGSKDYGSILTTDRAGSSGFAAGNYFFIDGTSFSAPVVSGVIALMLQANPNLGYRDVQQILAYTAQQVVDPNTSWAVNGATDWNGGGMHYNNDDQSSGFGQVDALAAVRLAAAWNAAPLTVANTHEAIVQQTVNKAIPDNNQSGVGSSITVSDQMSVERVDVAINITHTQVSQLAITLTSPSGTKSWLMWQPTGAPLSAFGPNQSNVHFTFDTVFDWGESGSGTWTLNVTDLTSGNVGTLDSWTLDLIGKSGSSDHNFIFTNEYPSLVAANPNRAILSDMGGGNDTINAGALGSNDRIDLSGKTASVILGANLGIAPGTVIKTAIGGDGHNVLIANDTGCTLAGMGGNDTLTGGTGVDTALYHSTKANFSITASGTNCSVVDNTGAEGGDTLTSIERLKFTEGSVALDVGATQSAGETVMLLGAVLPGKLVFDASKQTLLGAVIGLFDQGYKLQTLSGAVMRLPIWDVLTGKTAPSNADIANYLLTNINGSVPDASTLANAVLSLNTENDFSTQGNYLWHLAESSTNQTHVGLVGLATTGLAYVVQ